MKNHTCHTTLEPPTCVVIKHLLILTLTGFTLLLLAQCRPAETSTSEEGSSSDTPSETSPLQRHTYQQSLMGTRFFITLYTADKKTADLAAKEAFQMASDINDTCSDYDVTSELMHLNADPPHQAIPISDMLFDVINTALKISQQTQGAYDPTLGHHSYNWRMARKKGVLPSPKKIAAAKAASGWKNVHLDSEFRAVTKNIENMRLDLGGIAKGYAAEEMLNILKRHGITRASITAGGEVRLGDPPPETQGWKITLKTLDSQHQLSPKTLTLSNCAISTSGDLHQSITIGGQRYSHICDPATGLGLTTRISATVIGPNATLTDALATALCVNPTLEHPNIQTLIIQENSKGKLTKKQSPNWPR